ncbi:MAG: DNA mismatch repair endonuclease MutL [Firmicutes bacterium]|nr:DNA mismatch repair endonuclease MutL [Bacillota bacterium]
MRAEIRPLAEDVVARIAAGEVVERPAAALKELVENALDAGARRVEVRLAGGGADLLEVVDDGEGMAADALPLALTRHATSKIRTAEDLSAVSTYGFRGEALPAIAAAAGRLLLASCPEGGSGAEVEVVEGRAGPVLPAAVAPGTRVRVERLFAPLPARRAFLRSPQAEAAACHEVVVRAALAAPDVAFRLRSERGEVFASPGGGDRAQVVAAAYGPAARAALVSVDHRQDGVTVSGYVALPHVARANRAAQTFLVRGRPVFGRSLVYAAESAYAGRLPRARYPLFVLAIDLDPGEVDVNVHPQKREVRFADERRVAAAVHEAVRRALAGTAAPPSPAPAPLPQGAGAWRVGWPGGGGGGGGDV